MASRFFSVDREPTGDSSKDALTPSDSRSDIEAEGDLPPVVARMVVEIRSDGTKTVARGALEDLQNGERVAIQANAGSPVALARELTKSILATPVLASSLAKQAMVDALPPRVREKADAMRSKANAVRQKASKLRWPGKKS